MAKNGDKISNNDTIEAEMESDDSEEDSEEDDDVEEAEILNLQEKVKENPYNYDSHLELIRLLKKAGDLEKLREARQTMSEVFPLTPELWLDWLADEIRLEESRPRVYQLFDRAVQDYMSVSLWLEYIQYSIGDIGTEEGLQKIRGIAERALTAVGKNVAEGSLIWGAYREVETAVLAGLQPEPGRVASESLLERQEEQMKRMHSLFRRQLSVPLLHMETTWSEYKDWSDDNVEPQAQQAYEKATRQLQVLLPFEEELASAEGNKLEAYKSYLTREARENEDPARVQALFERAVVDNCLVPDLWLRYGKYVDKVLRARDVVLAVHKRAVRNCPWHVTLWLRYCRALERQCPDEHERIVEVFKRALFSDNFNQSNDFLQMWTGFIDYMRRRVHFESEHAKELEELRSTFQSAVDFLHSNYGNDGDPNCSIQQYWARIEAKFCSNMARARDLWSGVMQQGFGNQAQMWLEYINLERAYGDHKHCRKVLGRALNSTTDWPEYIVDAYVMFEREEGSLEQLDQAMERCDAQMQRIEERKAAEMEERRAKRRWRGNKSPPRKACKVCQNEFHPTLSSSCSARLQKPLFNVTSFKGKGDVFSNFYPCQVKVFGREFASSEHAYQYTKAIKCERNDIAEKILDMDCGREVKILSKQLKTDEDWAKSKLDTMREIIQAKAACVPEYRTELLNSRELIAEAVPDDKYWSCGLGKDDVIWVDPGRWPGQNMMGKLHMELRDKLKAEALKETSTKDCGRKRRNYVDSNSKEIRNGDQNKTEELNSNSSMEIENQQSKELTSKDCSSDPVAPDQDLEEPELKEPGSKTSKNKVKMKKGKKESISPKSKSSKKKKKERQSSVKENESESRVKKSEKESRVKRHLSKIERKRLKKMRKERRDLLPKVKIEHLDADEEIETMSLDSVNTGKAEEEKQENVSVKTESTPNDCGVQAKLDTDGVKLSDDWKGRKCSPERRNVEFENCLMETSDGDVGGSVCECYGVDFLNVILMRYENSSLGRSAEPDTWAKSHDRRQLVAGSREQLSADVSMPCPDRLCLMAERIQQRRAAFTKFLQKQRICAQIAAQTAASESCKKNKRVQLKRPSLTSQTGLCADISAGDRKPTAKRVSHLKDGSRSFVDPDQLGRTDRDGEMKTSQRHSKSESKINKQGEIKREGKGDSVAVTARTAEGGSDFGSALTLPRGDCHAGRAASADPDVVTPSTSFNETLDLGSIPLPPSPRERLFVQAADGAESGLKSRAGSDYSDAEYEAKREKSSKRERHKTKAKKKKKRKSLEKKRKSRSSESDSTAHVKSDAEEIKNTESDDVTGGPRDERRKKPSLSKDSRPVKQGPHRKVVVKGSKKNRSRSISRSRSPSSDRSSAGDERMKSLKRSERSSRSSSIRTAASKMASGDLAEEKGRRKVRVKGRKKASPSSERGTDRRSRSRMTSPGRGSKSPPRRSSLPRVYRRDTPSEDRDLGPAEGRDRHRATTSRSRDREDSPYSRSGRRHVRARHRRKRSGMSSESAASDTDSVFDSVSRDRERSGVKIRQKSDVHSRLGTREARHARRSPERSSRYDGSPWPIRDRRSRSASLERQPRTYGIETIVRNSRFSGNRVPWSDKRHDRQSRFEAFRAQGEGLAARGVKRPFPFPGTESVDSPMRKRSRSIAYSCVLCKSSAHFMLSADCPARAPAPHTNVTAFKGKFCVFSNFHRCRITYRGRDFTSSEHAYQHMKCLVCGRQDLADQILVTEEASTVKALVKGLELSPEWQHRKEDIMYEIIQAKAKWVKRYRMELENSKEWIAEAVPFDQVWSAGLAESDLLLTKREYWPGQNRMGHLHMRLRKELFGR